MSLIPFSLATVDGHGFTGKNRRVIFEAFLLAHRAMTALDDRARMQQIAERRNDRRTHPVRARGQNLHDQHLAEAIDDHARQPIAVAIDEAVRIGVIADEAPPDFERALQPPRDQFFNRGRLAPRDHPERDRRGRIAVTHAEKSARCVVHRDNRARFRRRRFDPLDCLRENPRIAAANGPFPAALQHDARERRAHRTGHGGSSSRAKSPLRPPRFATSRIAPISIARSIALAMS